MSRVFSNTTSLVTSVCMRYVGAMANILCQSQYADKLLKGKHSIKEDNSKQEANVSNHSSTKQIVSN